MTYTQCDKREYDRFSLMVQAYLKEEPHPVWGTYDILTPRNPEMSLGFPTALGPNAIERDLSRLDRSLLTISQQLFKNVIIGGPVDSSDYNCFNSCTERNIGSEIYKFALEDFLWMPDSLTAVSKDFDTLCHYHHEEDYLFIVFGPKELDAVLNWLDLKKHKHAFLNAMAGCGTRGMGEWHKANVDRWGKGT